MTLLADITASDIGTWILGAIAIVISVLAYLKTLRTDARDRQATIVIENVWSYKGNAWRVVRLPNGYYEDVDTHPRPAKPDIRLVIAGSPTIYAGLVLRPPTDQDNSDEDTTGNESYRIMFKFENVGRSAANDARVSCTLTGTFLGEHGGPNEDRVFDNVGFEIPTIPAGGQRHVEIRNVPSIPVSLTFDSIETQEKTQSVVMAGIRAADFLPRG
jgi:hypothetical protein